MKVIKFSTGYEKALSIDSKNFKRLYEEQIGDNRAYLQNIDGEVKHMAVCPQCNNPVAILGIYKAIKTAPHARHAKGVDIPGIASYNEYNYLHCPFHVKKADYIKEYVPETEEPARAELYKLAREHFDKAVYLLQKTTGLYISLEMARSLAENYAKLRVYNYIDATNYNIPWYLIYGYHGFGLCHKLVRKNSDIYRHLKKLGFIMKDSRRQDYVYVEGGYHNDKFCDYVLTATGYRYLVTKDEDLNEYLDFSILQPDKNKDVRLFNAIDRFSIKVDSHYFGNLIEYNEWNRNEKLLDIANDSMTGR